MVSPDSEERDTEPRECAAAGIARFRLVERDAARKRSVVHTRACDPVTHSRLPAGIHRDRLDIGVPYGIGIDPTAGDHLWRPAAVAPGHRGPPRGHVGAKVPGITTHPVDAPR
ncbi:hypothetical protein [Streptomyces sp. CAU 1734]|uniref:hypothetical protein n=1 Tax=Streptomyces sp. CAU 1734 TaxID=3140360 RepID=UPI003260CEBB